MRAPLSAHQSLSVAVETPEAMRRLGAQIAAHLRQGEAVCLSGPLGAGKTTLARGLVQAVMGHAEETPSPTFTLVQFYEGETLRLAHLDLYRLKDPNEAYELGLDEALEDGAAVIEWPERLGGALPPDRLDVEIGFSNGGEGRRVGLTGHGAWVGRDREL